MNCQKTTIQNLNIKKENKKAVPNNFDWEIRPAKSGLVTCYFTVSNDLTTVLSSSGHETSGADCKSSELPTKGFVINCRNLCLWLAQSQKSLVAPQAVILFLLIHFFNIYFCLCQPLIIHSKVENQCWIVILDCLLTLK